MRSSIHKVREQTAALRATLLAPSIEGLESHLAALQEAAITLRELQADQSAEPAVIEGASRQELEALARDLSTAGRLIAHGLAFQQGLTRLMASATSGYRPDGEPVTLHAAANIWVHG